MTIYRFPSCSLPFLCVSCTYSSPPMPPLRHRSSLNFFVFDPRAYSVLLSRAGSRCPLPPAHCHVCRKFLRPHRHPLRPLCYVLRRTSQRVANVRSSTSQMIEDPDHCVTVHAGRTNLITPYLTRILDLTRLLTGRLLITLGVRRVS